MKVKEKYVGIFLLVLIFIIVIIALLHLSSSQKNIAKNQKIIFELNYFYEVEKNGISFEDGTLIINSTNINPVGENKHQTIVFNKNNSQHQIIELNKASFTFIVKTRLPDKHVNDYFYCLEGEWNEFMKFIKKETRPVGAALPPIHGVSYNQYYF